MKYPFTKKYQEEKYTSIMMGPHPLKLCEELLLESKIHKNAVVCDLGSGQGLTSLFLAKEYSYHVYACDLWSDPNENQAFFYQEGMKENQLKAVKADANHLPFEKEFFDAIVCVDSYNYFGRDPQFLDEKLLPYLKKDGYIYIAIPGMKKDVHDHIPEELLLSWNEEQLDYIHDIPYWENILKQCKGAKIIKIQEMESNEEVWNDWLKQENPYAIHDRLSMEKGAGKYLNFIQIILQKK